MDQSKGAKPAGVNKPMLQLLRDVSGAFRPSILTALVGVSGAGKTTLMDVLAGRKTGIHRTASLHWPLAVGKGPIADGVTGRHLPLVAAGGIIEGDMRLNGHPKEQATFARISGCVLGPTSSS